MPDPPETGLLTRFVFENPYPLFGLLLVVAAALLWLGLREGRKPPLQAAGACAILAVAVVLTGVFVVTPAEHGERVAHDLVTDVVEGRYQNALNHFAPDAAFSFGSPRNPGFDFDYIRRQVNRVEREAPIVDNRITLLRGYTVDRETAEVHLACRTETERGFAPTPTEWVLRIEQQPDGSWLITRITWVSIRGQTPSERIW